MKRPPPPPHCASFNACIQYMQHCSRKTPPPPPPHSASYNIAATKTCASRVSASVGHRKRPPVQVTVATTTCASGVSVLVGHRKRPPVQVTVATTTCASRVSALVGHRKRPPVQVTVVPGQHMQVTADQNLHSCHWNARCSKQL